MKNEKTIPLFVGRFFEYIKFLLKILLSLQLSLISENKLLFLVDSICKTWYNICDKGFKLSKILLISASAMGGKMKKISVKKIVLFVILAIIAVFLAIWLGCLLRNYVLTVMYADEIKELPLYEGEVVPDYDLVRVLSYSENEIKVYFVEKVENHECEIGGIGIYRRNIYGEWSYIEDILWSTAGTADKLIWPYWHHIVYYFAP